MPPRLQTPCKVLTAGGAGRISSSLSSTGPSTTTTSTPRCPFYSTLPEPIPGIKKPTKLRRDFFAWLTGPGAVFKQPPEKNTTNYLGQYDLRTGEPKEGNSRNNRLPFPQNPVFVATPVVSDELANEVYKRVSNGKSVRMVSAELNVSLQRVAAIYRLKSVEAEWVLKEIPTKGFLTRAIHAMLPVTQMPRVGGGGGQRGQQGSGGQLAGGEEVGHEPINDLPSHQLTHAQLFIPVSESREFTREDAGKEFGLPSADERIPHPELIVDEREKLSNVGVEERRRRAMERDEKEMAGKKGREEGVRERVKREEVVLESGRWAWKLVDVKAGEVGYRYGVPHEDRKRGQVKIPTRVE